MSKSNGKIQKEFIETQVDSSTGETTTLRKTIVKTIPYDKFIKVYLEDTSGILDIGRGDIKVLSYCWKITEYNTGRIYLVKTIKEEMSEEIKIKLESIDNIIYRLVKKNLLISEGTSVYRLNPAYFWKGEESARAEALEIVIKYNLTSSTPSIIPIETKANEGR
jgi:predicted transcriptional regulator